MSSFDIKSLVEGLPAERTWKNFGTCPRAGVVEYTARLSTEDDWGIGDFRAVNDFLEICVDTGLTIFQFLPLNDSGADSSPYCTVSANALDPKYISISMLVENLEALGYKPSKGVVEKIEAMRLESRGPETRDAKPEKFVLVDGRRVVLPHPEVVSKRPFVEIKKLKLTALELLWKDLLKKKKLGVRTRVDEFVAANTWVEGYSTYMSLFEKYGSHWESWPTEFRSPDSDLIDTLHDENSERCAFFEFLQMVTFDQLRSVHFRASTLGVKLVGDLPLLLNRGSADVWANQGDFRLDLAAGAPPDQFSEDGQNWGFCPYNWPVMARSDYRLIRERMAFAANFYDANRIDHILGDFRIWAMEHVHLKRKIWKESAGDGFYFPQYPVHGDTLSEAFGIGLEHLIDKEVLMPVTPKMLGEYEIPWGFAIKWTFDKTPLFRSLDDETRKKWLATFKWFREERHKELWMDHGARILSMKLESAPNMLPLGEDLGDVPASVRKTMRAIGIPGMKVLRWENAWSQSRGRMAMAPQDEFEPVSMATVGVHDAETLRQWWEDPTLEDVVSEIKAIHATRRAAVAEDLEIPVFGAADSGTCDLIRRELENVDYLLKKVDVADDAALIAYFNEPMDPEYYAGVLRERLASRETERQNAWEDLGFNGPAPSRMGPDLLRRMIELSYNSSSVMAVNPLTEILGMWGLTALDPRNDRINKPGIVDARNWEGRLPFTVAELSEEMRKPSVNDKKMTRAQEARSMAEKFGRLPYSLHHVAR